MIIRITFGKTGIIYRARIVKSDEISSSLLAIYIGWKAELIVKLAFDIGAKIIRKYRDGRETIEISDEDNSLKIFIATIVAKRMRSRKKYIKILDNLKESTDQEIKLLYALATLYKKKSIPAIRKLLS